LYAREEREEVKMIANEDSRTEENGWVDLDKFVDSYRHDPKTTGIYIADTINEDFPERKCAIVFEIGRFTDICRRGSAGRVLSNMGPANYSWVTGYEFDDEKVRITSYDFMQGGVTGEDPRLTEIRKGKNLLEEIADEDSE
jgi:hypothetical protein